MPDPALSAHSLENASTAPIAREPDSGRELCEALAGRTALGAHLGQDSPLRALLHGAGGCAPFLARIAVQEGDWLAQIVAQDPACAFDALLSSLAAAPGASTASYGSSLRRTKRRVALLVALADLGGLWTLDQVMEANTRFADRVCAMALRFLLRGEGAFGRTDGCADEEAPERHSGLFLVAMGKQGAGELNYSSDIDLIALYDEEKLPARNPEKTSGRYVRLIRRFVGLLSEMTGEGYVLRTDFRLRPDPGATPVCMGAHRAENYYASMGRSWERAAWIKARICAGDREAGDGCIARLSPFVWRKYLDFSAIEETHAMIERIRDHKGGREIELGGHDIKLGAGGIREIEFFAQVRQLISGGRDASLRSPKTLKALEAIAKAGWIDGATRTHMMEAYRTLRTIEHRLQMVEDAQTHVIPAERGARERVACLAGYETHDAFARALLETLHGVDGTIRSFFRAKPSATPGASAPAFDGQEDGAACTWLADRGFKAPQSVLQTLAGWHHGRVPATRTRRAQATLARIMPRLLERFASAASPNEAFAHFGNFLAGLPVGVQLFSLFEAHPDLMDIFGEICAAAPRLAEYLGRNAAILDTMLDRDFLAPLPGDSILQQEARRVIGGGGPYEAILDRARIWAKEKSFGLSVRVLHGGGAARGTESREGNPCADPALCDDPGRGFSAIAEAAILALIDPVIAEFSTRYGPPPGAETGGGLAILALGKLGSREMTAASDLDLIAIYEPGEATHSRGARPLPPAHYYARLTQKIVAAICAPTAKGAMYAVDMRLRPSGRKGPLATSLGAFSGYQAREAWIWEHMALTRARILTGAPPLRMAIARVIAETLGTKRDRTHVLREARAMRTKMTEAFPAPSPWSVKHARGGLVDIEFMAQALMLIHGEGGQGGQGIVGGLEALAQKDRLGAEAARDLTGAARLQLSLLQLGRIANARGFDPEKAGPGFRSALVRALGRPDFDTLKDELCAMQVRVRRHWEALFGESNGTGPRAP